jgi:hypothetical protein
MDASSEGIWTMDSDLPKNDLGDLVMILSLNVAMSATVVILLLLAYYYCTRYVERTVWNPYKLKELWSDEHTSPGASCPSEFDDINDIMSFTDLDLSDDDQDFVQ